MNLNIWEKEINLMEMFYLVELLKAAVPKVRDFSDIHANKFLSFEHL